MKIIYGLRWIICLLCLITVSYVFSEVFSFKFKDGGYCFQKFYELPPESVDVLVIGSSHAFMDISPEILYRDYGIAAFDLCASSQPVWNSYYYLKEALKSQTPRLVIFEAYETKMSEEYSPIRGGKMKNLHGMKWSMDKIDAIRVSVPKSERAEYFLPFIGYHSRYASISKEDFYHGCDSPLYQDNKGFYTTEQELPQIAPNVAGVTLRKKMHPKVEEYYRKIISLTQEREIPLYILVTPYTAITPDEQAIFNTASDIAREQGIPFVNFNIPQIGVDMDFQQDFPDVGHMNYKGSEKFSKALGLFLCDEYNLPDRRGNISYHSWEINLQRFMDNVERIALNKETDPKKTAQYLKMHNNIVFISTNGEVSAADPQLAAFFSEWGVEGIGEKGIWMIENGTVVNRLDEGMNESKYVEINGHDVLLEQTKTVDNKWQQRIRIDRKEYQKLANGLQIIVYNPRLEMVIDAFSFGPDSNYQCVRWQVFPLLPNFWNGI